MIIGLVHNKQSAWRESCISVENREWNDPQIDSMDLIMIDCRHQYVRCESNMKDSFHGIRARCRIGWNGGSYFVYIKSNMTWIKNMLVEKGCCDQVISRFRRLFLLRRPWGNALSYTFNSVRKCISDIADIENVYVIFFKALGWHWYQIHP